MGFLPQKISGALEEVKSTSVGSADENSGKNRTEAVIPYDRNRVILTPIPGKEHSTYINASFIEVILTSMISCFRHQYCIRLVVYLVNPDHLGKSGNFLCLLILFPLSHNSVQVFFFFFFVIYK